MSKNDDKDALNELVRRFTISSRKLAKSTHLEYLGMTKAEYEDLVAIGLCAFCVSLNKYNREGNFFSFWKNVAYHDMIEHIKQFSITIKVNGEYINIVSDEEIDADWVFASDESVESSAWGNILFEKMIKILNSPRYRFSERDKMIFTYYINDYSINEIADLFGMTYHNVHSRINRIRGELANILKYSNE